ncbi:MAG: hypothetical protein HY284_02720 [Nitrospirae bacterium]|nr:hypothetical protein [Nitrospirota bacterium]
MPANYEFSDEKFDALMERIDSKLASKGVGIAAREIHAFSEISIELGIELRLIDLDEPPPDPPWPTDQISVRLIRWYEKRYGDKLKMDFSVGKVALLIRGDIWVSRIPLAYGRIRFYCDPVKVDSPSMRSDGQPALCDVLGTIIDMSDGVRSTLSLKERRSIADIFRTAYEAYYSVLPYASIPLVKAALADHETAVTHLAVRNPHPGQSKWASLQATEKLLKAVIESRGMSFTRVHNLSTLVKEAELVGAMSVSHQLVDQIQCDPGVRYGEAKTSLDDSLSAHYAALKITNLCGTVLSQKQS